MDQVSAQKFPQRIALIGIGAMGSALMGAWAHAPALASTRFYGVDPHVTAISKAPTNAVEIFKSIDELPEVDCVVIAVKPQVIAGVLEQLKGYLEGLSGSLPLVISIAAGITTTYLEAALPPLTPVIRTMPNLALTVGEGMSALTAGRFASEESLALVQGLFGLVGRVCLVKESAIDAVCALSGSGSAYFALLAESMAEAGYKLGLDENLSQELATQTLIGTAALLNQGSYDPLTLRKAVTSPGGTTEAALNALIGAGFASAVTDGVQAAFERGRALGVTSANR